MPYASIGLNWALQAKAGRWMFYFCVQSIGILIYTKCKLVVYSCDNFLFVYVFKSLVLKALLYDNFCDSLAVYNKLGRYKLKQDSFENR